MDAPLRGTAQASPSPAANGTPAQRPSLLPAFEPCSSSPGLPRPLKRKLREAADEPKYYPTPVPTSSAGNLPSSPPARLTRPHVQRAVSALSERAPLGDVPTLKLPLNGEPILIGRSSNSSDYQLPANRHISRVHVRASYHATEEEYPNGQVEVECLGWNGAKVHCRGEVVDLAKGELFVSGNPMAQIIVDVQDTRVMISWPEKDAQEASAPESKSLWTSHRSSASRHAAPAHDFGSSPPVLLPPRPASPVSPTPALHLGATFLSTFRADSEEPVQIYQDQDCGEGTPCEQTPEPTSPVCREGTPTPKRALSSPAELARPLASFATEQEEFSEHDEENDPIVHSFGPFGDNLMSRFESFASSPPERKRKPLKASANSPGRSVSAPAYKPSPIRNHVINQLAYSRIHSLPLSTIHSNLPAELRGAMAKPSDHENREVLHASDLKTLLDDIPCVGEISREGKDAAGKLLESEFYYVPELDTDVDRRETVTQSLGKTSIRAARKQHKQYYWKRPRF